MLNLDSKIQTFAKVNARNMRDFLKLGIQTARDLLFHIPFRYEDFSNLIPASAVKIGQRATCKVQVNMISGRRTKSGRHLTEAIFRDETGSIKAVWFNQRWILRALCRGTWIYLAGKLEESPFGIHMINPVFEYVREGQETIHAGRLVPIYHASGALTPRIIRTQIANIINLAGTLPEWLPSDLIKKRGMMPLAEALSQIHFPKDRESADRARERIAYGELFIAALHALAARKELDAQNAPKIPFREKDTRKFVSALPFDLTDDQKKAAWRILRDMDRERPMNRLLEGEVGSGKTVVAALAALNGCLHGFQIVYLAPTEILASQHYKTLSGLFRNFRVRTALLTLSHQEYCGEPLPRKTVEEKIKDGSADIIVGTHALIQKSSEFSKVGLVIIDEQHRFGVEQRKRLRELSAKDEVFPHFLSMTATPIPRSLALTVCGDLDLTVLRELPKGRTPVRTELVLPKNQERAYLRVREEIKKGRQSFVICPRIEEDDKNGTKSAEKIWKELSLKVFPDLKVALLHGKLKADKKLEVMEEFRSGRSDILVSTSVVEVGVDIPNASAMIIFGAERFGLAQLHQFRGRIGRGGAASICFLFCDGESEADSARLRFFTSHRDGFELAEYDLAARGPGEILGAEQSGFQKFRAADFTNRELVLSVRRDAREIMEKGLLRLSQIPTAHLE